MRIECFRIALSVGSVVKSAFTKRSEENTESNFHINDRTLIAKQSEREKDRRPKNKSAIAADILLCVRFTQFNHTRNRRSGRDNKHIKCF